MKRERRSINRSEKLRRNGNRWFVVFLPTYDKKGHLSRDERAFVWTNDAVNTFDKIGYKFPDGLDDEHCYLPNIRQATPEEIEELKDALNECGVSLKLAKAHSFIMDRNL